MERALGGARGHFGWMTDVPSVLMFMTRRRLPRGRASALGRRCWVCGLVAWGAS